MKSVCVFSVAVLVCTSVIGDAANPPETPATIAQRRFQAGQTAEQQNDYIRAESEYREVLGVSLEQLGASFDKLGLLNKAEGAYREAISAASDSDAALFGLSVVYLKKGEAQKGIDTVHTLLAQRPSDAQARSLLGKLYFSANRYDAAALEFQEALRLTPDDSDTSVTLAFAYLKQQQLEKAQKIFAALLKAHGESAKIHVMFGAAYRQTEYVNEALDEFQRAASIDPNYPRLHYYTALAYLSQERSNATARALTELAEQIRVRPDDYEAQYLTGVVYVQEHDLEHALPYLEKAASLEPDNPDPLLYLGQALYLLGRTDRAIPLLNKAVDLTKDPSRNNYQISKAHYMIGQFLARRGQAEEAKRELAAAEDLKAKASLQDQVRLKRYVGMGHGQGKEDVKAAISGMEGKAVVIPPEPPSPAERATLQKGITFYTGITGAAYNQLGLLRARGGDFARAAALLEKAQQWTPDIPELPFNLGLAEFKTQNYAAAIAPLGQALARKPDRVDARTLLGLSLYFASDYRRAAETLTPLMKAGVDDPQFAYAYGLSLAHSGDRGRGLQVLEALAARYPQSADAHVALGQALALNEDYSKAAAEFSRALELDRRFRRALLPRPRPASNVAVPGSSGGVPSRGTEGSGACQSPVPFGAGARDAGQERRSGAAVRYSYSHRSVLW